MSVKATFKSIEKLFNKLDAANKQEVLKKSLRQAMLNMKAWSMDKRLTGPRPEHLGVVSGRLRSSLRVTDTEKIGSRYVSRMGTNVVYAPIHEFGGRTGRNRSVLMRARPFLQPAVEDRENIDKTLQLLVININRAIRNA